METAKELLIIAGRIITILPLMLVVTLVMGKRSIGELPVFDFLIIITMGSVVGADIADPKINHLYTAVAIVLIGALQLGVAKMNISSRKIGRLTTFEPTIVIRNGKFLPDSLRRIRYSLDNTLQMLREKDVFDVEEVDIGIIEANGKMTVLKKSGKETVTLEDMGINKKKRNISYPVVVDGLVKNKVLTYLNVTEEWLNEKLRQQGVQDIKGVFFASVNEQQELRISLKDEPYSAKEPPILH